MNLSKSSMIVVSNRLPVSLSFEKDGLKAHTSSGGLVSAMSGVQRELPFTWIGWPGVSFPINQHEEVKNLLSPKHFVPVFISKEQEKHYYHDFCNSTLWPLFHYFTDRMKQLTSSWKAYTEVNQLFASKVIENAQEGATVWVHDFHLMLLPSLIREKRPDLKIGFFLHIPFPSSEIYRMFPQREKLLKGVLGADYIGLHTTDYTRHFRLSCLRILGLDSNHEGILYEGRHIGVGTHPIGMNIAAFDEILAHKDYSNALADLKKRYRDYQVILGVERLDYTKGIGHKLQAFEKLLETNPELVGHVILLQIIVPCRQDSVEYQKHRSKIENRISHINGKYSKPGFTPIQYIYRNLPLSELAALYCLADVCMVTPLRDGMNLVAQEFVYCAHKEQSKGVLLLSEFAGASHHLPHALMVNPLDVEGVTQSLFEALMMPEEQKLARLNKMSHSINQLDSPLWAAQFLESLEKTTEKNSSQINSLRLSPESVLEIASQAAKSQNRILILDYDGTLREITSYPMQASPSDEILKLLKELGELENTEVHLVSGRDYKTLQLWFDNSPIHLSSEHGFLNRALTEKKWLNFQQIDLSWIPYVHKILNKVVEEVPGSFLETKTSSLCWHYRMADLDYGKWRAKELTTLLMQELTNLPVEVILGKQVIEVRAQGISKGNYVKHILNNRSSDDFILCIGDDRTDLDMYAALPQNGISIQVGESVKKTSYQIDSPLKVRELLQTICNACRENQTELNQEHGGVF